MADIQHELAIRASRAKVLESLTSLAALERWNHANVTSDDHAWTVAYPNGPTFRWKVVEASSNRIVWRCEEGPGNAGGSEVIFSLSDADRSRTLIRLTHLERGGDDPHHARCNTLWGILLGRIQSEAEKDVSSPG